MASSKVPPLPFGFATPSENDYGQVARNLILRAEENVDKARKRALWIILPALLYYLLFSLGVRLVLWSMHVQLTTPLFLLVTATCFLFFALLGRHYRMQSASSLLEAPFYHMKILILQAYFVKVLTACFFIFPYRIVKSLSNIFPRIPRLSPQVLDVAVQAVTAMDLPVKQSEIRSILPPGVPPNILNEALLLLTWSDVIVTQPLRGDLSIFPTRGRESAISSVASEGAAGIVTFSSLMSGMEESARLHSVPQPQAPVTQAVSHDDAPPRPTSAPPGPPSAQRVSASSAQRSAPHPVSRPAAPAPPLPRAARKSPFSIKHVLLFVLLLVIAGGGWLFIQKLRSRLDVALAPGALPVAAGYDGITFADGHYYIGEKDRITVTSDLASTQEEEMTLDHLGKLWSKTGMAAGENQWGTTVSYKMIARVLPEPGGSRLLVYGKWKCDPGPASCNYTGWTIVDPENKTIFPCTIYNVWAVRGWWEKGRILASKGGPRWEKGGGGRRGSDNTAGTIFAVDVNTGDRSSLYTPSEPYFGYAGREDGDPIFLAATWVRDEMVDKTTFTMTEYRGFQRGHSFKWVIKERQPILRHVALTPDGEYWIVGVEWSNPGVVYKRSRNSFWIFSRDGRRRGEVSERTEKRPSFLETFTSGGKPYAAWFSDPYHPVFSYREIISR